MLTKEQYAAYCDTMEQTAKWGGQCEIQALAAALGRPIRVYQATSPPHEAGDMDRGNPILLSYHQHEYSLGSHYNAVMVKDS
eukprot:m.221034 g.221034  ORF g.221034 m.221034 type:complete len:82 (+) comp31748_c0_seq1:489-734(+)